MKKLLLSLLCLVGSVAAWAGSADLNTMNGGQPLVGYSTNSSDCGWKAVNCAIFDNTTSTMIPADSLAVCMNGKTTAVGTLTSPTLTGGIGTLTFGYGYNYSEKNGISIKVSILQNGVEVASTDVVNSSAKQNTANEAILDFNISGDFVIKFTNNSPSNSTSNKDRFSLWSITWTEYGGSTLEQLEKPVISPEEGQITADTEISISCENTEAAIYYTIDGTNPTAEDGTLYTAPFTVDKTCTVKAIAVAEGYSTSSIASASYIVPFNVENIAAFITEADTQTPITISGAVTAVYMNGRNLYIKDETGAILIYDTNDVVTDGKYSNGDIITGVTGVYKSQNGLPELIPSADLPDAVAGTAVEPVVVTLDAVTADMMSQYVKIEKVSIAAASSSNNYTLTDTDNNTLALYNTFYNSSYYDAVTVPEGDNITVVGFVGCYNSTVQINPTECIIDQSIAQTPVITPEGGQITADEQITITCATEGASIYYTLDGTTPSATNGTLYTEPFTISEDCTIKAIAVMEGITDSEVAEATFTIKVVDLNAQSVTYDFTNPSTLTPATNTPATGAGVTVNETGFTAGNITLTCTKGTAGTDCRLWNTSGNITLRTYKNSSITISADNATIQSIEFTGSKVNNTYFTTDTGTFTGTTWTPAESTSQVVFSCTTNAQIGTVTVTYSLETGVNVIEAEESSASVEYYNLQGVKVANPAGGLYIRVQGNKATKVLVK